MTVQEGFFFREPSRFDLLRQAILPGISDPVRPLRVWSAGCAAGEEAYSLGIVLRNAGRFRPLPQQDAEQLLVRSAEG